MGDLWRLLVEADFLCVAVDVGKRLLQMRPPNVQLILSSGRPFIMDPSADNYYILRGLIYCRL